MAGFPWWSCTIRSRWWPLRASRGTVLLEGRNLAQIRPRGIPALRRRLGMVFQDHRLLLDRSLFDNLALPLIMAGVSRAEIGRRVRAALDRVGLLARERALPTALSAGEQQRVGIARTLLHDPQVLILDEPANGLDPRARIEMRELLLRLASEGKTLIVTSHILPELARICDTVAIITDGKLQAFGKLDEVMRELCPTRSYEVQLVRNDQIDSASSLLQTHVKNATVTISRPERTLRFPTTDSEAALAGALKQLIQEGIEVAQFHEVAGDLEDAFLTVAARGK